MIYDTLDNVRKWQFAVELIFKGRIFLSHKNFETIPSPIVAPVRLWSSMKYVRQSFWRRIFKTLCVCILAWSRSFDDEKGDFLASFPT